MNPITTKLFAIPVAVASLIMAYSCSTPETKEDVQIAPVPVETLDSTTTTQATTIAPEFVEEDKKVEVPPMTVDQARQVYGKCGEWHDLAMMVGWPANEWPTLSYVLHRESRCNIDSWNRTDPHSGSRGLMQINGFWCRPNRYDPNGFLQSVGVLNNCEDLFDPVINLRAGLAIWTYGENKHGCGWRGPWATKCQN